ncbi:PTS sugar transporter subunit IIA [Microbacterium schleiferi]|uniref:PTS sugar transporter subunit IIA n=1 Tax=Microbacterium schleiferi TaxID=69362 RepID=A0A7S8MYS6_9MICO|nr:fructose-specific PTS transporter subunit EIIC [Microbacterium schleiferi]QPE05393.1 PTS sugar transporter subunit IIA [Microbacterium schleiferi]
MSIITTELVALDVALGATSSDVIDALSTIVACAGRTSDARALATDAHAREAQTSTGMPGGIAIPHCRTAAVTEPTLAFARLSDPVDFGDDDPSDLVFFIAAPIGADTDHLAILSTIARALVRDEFVASLRAATSAPEVVALIDEAIAPAPAASPAASAPAPAADQRLLVAVTACPTGIAHTYMAADALVAEAKKRGVRLEVETQGSSGSTALDPAVIAAADAVIFAVDVDVRDRARFAGKPVVQGPVKRGVEAPGQMIDEALAAAADPSATRISGAPTTETTDTASEHVGRKLQRWLLTGVSYMIPFVAGGGLLIALSFWLGGYDINATAGDIVASSSLWNLPDGGLQTYIGAVAFVIGAASMGFLVPALAGFIAYAMADRPGIAPGFVVGTIAVMMDAGFLGGIVGGLLAGLVAGSLARIPAPRWLRGLMPVVIIPLLASIAASGAMILFLGGPIAWLMTTLTDWLNSLTGVGIVLLGVILGLMMCFDLGGPVNKVAYSFAVAGLGAASVANQVPLEIMAAVMASGMVPPLGLALASTLLARKQFTPVERENGVAAWLLGASFISEGAIPFAAADPLRVIPASMLGGAVTGALSMAFGVTSQAPHGGFFVLFAIGNILWFVLSIAIGTVITALAVIAFKRIGRRPSPETVEAAGAADDTEASGVLASGARA